MPEWKVTTLIATHAPQAQQFKSGPRPIHLSAREREMNDPHAICRKWVARLGLGFHPDTRGADYTPNMREDEIAEYDADMTTLFACAADPYECGLMAMADAGLTE
jgi:hypothetical protein